MRVGHKQPWTAAEQPCTAGKQPCMAAQQLAGRQLNNLLGLIFGEVELTKNCLLQSKNFF